MSYGKVISLVCCLEKPQKLCFLTVVNNVLENKLKEESCST